MVAQEELKRLPEAQHQLVKAVTNGQRARSDSEEKHPEANVSGGRAIPVLFVNDKCGNADDNQGRHPYEAINDIRALNLSAQY